MRAFRIDMIGVTEIDVPDDFLEQSDLCWDCFAVDAAHDVWVDDMGLNGPEPDLARIGSNGAVPLPAYVFGSAGERTVSASMSIEDVEALVSGRRRPVALTYSTSSSVG